MLPNTENMDDLILDFEEEEQLKTKTFAINELNRQGELKSPPLAILGEAIVGSMQLSRIYGYTMGGVIDELAALKQSVFLRLSVEADQYIIYPYTYGLVTVDLIGKPHYYVMAILPDRIKETLLRDDRVLDVIDFEFYEIKNRDNVVLKSKLGVKFVVRTIYGDFNEETEVAY